MLDDAPHIKISTESPSQSQALTLSLSLYYSHPPCTDYPPPPSSSATTASCRGDTGKYFRTRRRTRGSDVLLTTAATNSELWNGWIGRCSFSPEATATQQQLDDIFYSGSSGGDDMHRARRLRRTTHRTTDRTTDGRTDWGYPYPSSQPARPMAGMQANSQQPSHSSWN